MTLSHTHTHTLRASASIMLCGPQAASDGEGARNLALDTSEDAHGLISMYEARNYGGVGHGGWRLLTNYRSVLMAKALRPHA